MDWRSFLVGCGRGDAALVMAAICIVVFAAACSDSDDVGGENGEPRDCPAGEEWNPIEGECVSSHNGEPDDAGPIDDVEGGDNLEEVECGPGAAPTSLSGTVTIPSGELPLPDVTVYIPASEPEQFAEGASCEPCQDELSGSPIVDTQTNIQGGFRLNNVPAGDEIPLVIEVGKWRRQITVENVEPCQENEITDLDKTRLPRNQQEGDIPQFAVTTGEYDALECLLRKIGIDDSEFTPETENGRVHLFAGQGGTDRYSNSLNGGASFTRAWHWWDELDNLLDYDIVVHSCEGNAYMGDKSSQARETLQAFTEAGGRVFLSHWHHVWLSEGTSDFQSVAEWADMAAITGVETETGYIDTSFDKGQTLREWMFQTGTEPAGELPINETRGSLESLNEEFSQQWIWIEPEPVDLPGFPGGGELFPDPPDELIQYFSFNTPLGVQPNDQCGRVVFSDIHVSAGEQSAPEHPFPTGCTDSSLTPQEKALVFMLFDLSRCIVPDKKDAAAN